MNEVLVIEAAQFDVARSHGMGIDFATLPEVFDVFIDDLAIVQRRKDWQRILNIASQRGYRVTKQACVRTFRTQYRFDRRPPSPTNCELNPL